MSSPLRQTISWVALPHGAAEEDPNRPLRLSVFASPRLLAEDGASATLTLDQYAPLQNWVDTLTTGVLTFDVDVADPATAEEEGNGTPVVVRKTIAAVPIASDLPRADLWNALFPGSTLVRPFQFTDLSDRAIVGYPTRNVLAYVQERYQRVLGQSALDVPRDRDLVAHFGEIIDLWDTCAGIFADGSTGGNDAVAPDGQETPFADRLSNQLAAVGQAAAARRQARAGKPIGAADGTLIRPRHPEEALRDTPADDFYRAMQYHYRPHPAEHQELKGEPDDIRRMLDFHQLLATLGNFPDLLRRLGLVFDLQIPRAELPDAALGNPLRLRVRPTFASPPPLDATTPWTAYCYVEHNNAIFFRAAARGQAAESELGLGLLLLGAPGRYQLSDVDVDGAALKTLLLGNALWTRPERITTAAPETTSEGLAPLRSAGLALARLDHDQRLNEAFNRAHNQNMHLEGGRAVTLYADDLARGYRFDIRDTLSSGWRSLHERTGRATFPAYPGGARDEPLTAEGFVQIGATEPARVEGTDAAPTDPLFVHDWIARWSGWSLSVPRPGKSVSHDPQASAGTVRYDNAAKEGGLQLETEFTVVPNSLPRLRFGREYRLRARVVDLAGNSPSLAEADAAAAYLRLQGLPEIALPAGSEGMRHGRFEPVDAPALAPRTAYADGETIDRLVIRSDAGGSTAAYATLHPAYSSENERHVVPPKIPQALTEAHGLFDGALGLTPAPPGSPVPAPIARTYALSLAEAGTLNDTEAVDLANPSGPRKMLPGVTTEVVVPAVASGPDAGPAQHYAIHGEEQLILPYLPDLLARGAAFRGLPGATGTLGQLGPTGALAFTPLPDGLPPTVTIPFADGADWPLWRPFRVRLAEPADPAQVAPTWDPAARILTVRLPQGREAIVKLSSYPNESDLVQLGIWRWALDQATQAGGDSALWAQQASLGAWWMLTPPRTLRLVHAVQRPLLVPQLHDLRARRQLGETRAHLAAAIDVDGESTLRLDLEAEWQDVVDDPALAAPPPTEVQSRSPIGELLVPLDSSDSPPTAEPPSQGVRYDPARRVLTLNTLFRDLDHDNRVPPAQVFPDTKHRRVRYRAVATTRFREYLPPAVRDDPSAIVQVGAWSKPLSVPSSAPPIAPAVEYAIPNFRWTTMRIDDAANGTERERHQRRSGVRVYLRRPWFSSGEGELLGVVVWQPCDTVPPQRVRRMVSHWGQDPAWSTASVAAAPRPEHFRNALEERPDVTLQEFPDTKVTVVGYPVHYSAERDRWFADIELAPLPSYFPFIRLALVRYQPESVDGAHISPVVLADFLQLTPSRTATLVRHPDQPGTVRLTVRGAALPHQNGVAGPATGHAGFDVRVQQRQSGQSDELGWSEVPSGVAVVTAAPSSPLLPWLPGDEELWAGEITLPPGRGAGECRILIGEAEQWATDRGSDERLVYLDTFLV